MFSVFPGFVDLLTDIEVAPAMEFSSLSGAIQFLSVTQTVKGRTRSNEYLRLISEKTEISLYRLKRSCS